MITSLIITSSIGAIFHGPRPPFGTHVQDEWRSTSTEDECDLDRFCPLQRRRSVFPSVDTGWIGPTVIVRHVISRPLDRTDASSAASSILPTKRTNNFFQVIRVQCTDTDRHASPNASGRGGGWREAQQRGSQLKRGPVTPRLVQATLENTFRRSAGPQSVIASSLLVYVANARNLNICKDAFLFSKSHEFPWISEEIVTLHLYPLYLCKGQKVCMPLTEEFYLNRKIVTQNVFNCLLKVVSVSDWRRGT